MESVSLLCFVGSILLISFVFLASAIRIVREDTRLSVYRLGRYIGEKGPGVVILIPIIDRGALKKPGDVEKIPARDFRATWAKHAQPFTLMEGSSSLAKNGMP